MTPRSEISSITGDTPKAPSTPPWHGLSPMEAYVLGVQHQKSAVGITSQDRQQAYRSVAARRNKLDDLAVRPRHGSFALGVKPGLLADVPHPLDELSHGGLDFVDVEVDGRGVLDRRSLAHSTRLDAHFDDAEVVHQLEDEESSLVGPAQRSTDLVPDVSHASSILRRALQWVRGGYPSAGRNPAEGSILTPTGDVAATPAANTASVIKGHDEVDDLPCSFCDLARGAGMPCDGCPNEGANHG